MRGVFITLIVGIAFVAARTASRAGRRETDLISLPNYGIADNNLSLNPLHPLTKIRTVHHRQRNMQHDEDYNEKYFTLYPDGSTHTRSIKRTQTHSGDRHSRPRFRNQSQRQSLGRPWRHHVNRRHSRVQRRNVHHGLFRAKNKDQTQKLRIRNPILRQHIADLIVAVNQGANDDQIQCLLESTRVSTQQPSHRRHPSFTAKRKVTNNKRSMSGHVPTNKLKQRRSNKNIKSRGANRRRAKTINQSTNHHMKSQPAQDGPNQDTNEDDNTTVQEPKDHSEMQSPSSTSHNTSPVHRTHGGASKRAGRKVDKLIKGKVKGFGRVSHDGKGKKAKTLLKSIGSRTKQAFGKKGKMSGFMKNKVGGFVRETVKGRGKIGGLVKKAVKGRGKASGFVKKVRSETKKAFKGQGKVGHVLKSIGGTIGIGKGKGYVAQAADKVKGRVKGPGGKILGGLIKGTGMMFGASAHYEYDPYDELYFV